MLLQHAYFNMPTSDGEVEKPTAPVCRLPVTQICAGAATAPEYREGENRNKVTRLSDDFIRSAVHCRAANLQMLHHLLPSPTDATSLPLLRSSLPPSRISIDRTRQCFHCITERRRRRQVNCCIVPICCYSRSVGRVPYSPPLIKSLRRGQKEGPSSVRDEG